MTREEEIRLIEAEVARGNIRRISLSDAQCHDAEREDRVAAKASHVANQYQEYRFVTAYERY